MRRAKACIEASLEAQGRESVKVGGRGAGPESERGTQKPQLARIMHLQAARFVQSPVVVVLLLPAWRAAQVGAGVPVSLERQPTT